MGDAIKKIIDDYKAKRGGVFALGNFDGVHRGHQSVVKTAIQRAAGLNVPAKIITFEPHPRLFFRPDLPPFRLTSAGKKARILQAFGVDDVLTIPFTREFSEISANDFVERFLIEGLGAEHLVVGFDYVFGHNQQGNVELLRQLLAKYNVGLTEVAPFRDKQGLMMSSSAARTALHDGDMARVVQILGRYFSVTGKTLAEDASLRFLGDPVAVISWDAASLRPKAGAYVIQARMLASSQLYQGVAYTGIPGREDDFIFHIFAPADDISGQIWEVEMTNYLRPMKDVLEIQNIHQQIIQDIDRSKQVLDA